jgi:hypothetical protein
MRIFGMLIAVLANVSVVPLAIALESPTAQESPLPSSQAHVVLQSYSIEPNSYVPLPICRVSAASKFSPIWNGDKAPSSIDPDPRWCQFSASSLTFLRGVTGNTSFVDVAHLQTASLVTDTGSSPGEIQALNSPGTPRGQVSRSTATGHLPPPSPKTPLAWTLLGCLAVMTVIAMRRLSWPHLSRLALGTRPS